MSVHFFFVVVYIYNVYFLCRKSLDFLICVLWLIIVNIFFLLIHTYHPSISILLNFSYFSTIKLHAKNSDVAGLGYDKGLNTSEC